jgi:hypothetical protein
MTYCPFCGRQHNVGFVSTRFAGTDGVSLETAKWADVFEGVGFSCSGDEGYDYERRVREYSNIITNIFYLIFQTATYPSVL